MFFRLAILVCLAGFTLTGCFLVQNNPAQQTSTNSRDQMPRNPELEQQYEQQLKEAMAPFFSTGSTVGLREKVLDIRSPAYYLDLHLNLVLALEAAEQAAGHADAVAEAQAIDRISELANQYPWLK